MKLTGRGGVGSWVSTEKSKRRGGEKQVLRFAQEDNLGGGMRLGGWDGIVKAAAGLPHSKFWDK